MREEERTGRLGEASVASNMGPAHWGPGRNRVGTGSPELGQKPGAGTHGASRRRGLLCSAYPWGGRGAGAARPPPPCRLSNSTSGLEEKREGRWGVGVSGRPAAAGRTGAGVAALLSPRRLLPGRPAGTGNRSSRNFPPSGRGAGGQQNGPEAAGRAGGIWGRMARAAATASAEAGRGRWLSQLPWNPVIREAAVGEGEELGRPEGAGRGVGPLQVPVS